MSSFLCVSYVCVGGLDHHDILVSKIDIFLILESGCMPPTYTRQPIKMTV